MFPFTSAEYPDSLTLFKGGFHDNGGITFSTQFVGKVYKYITLSGCDTFSVTLNGVRMANGKNRIEPSNHNTVNISSSTVTNTGKSATITLSKT